MNLRENILRILPALLAACVLSACGGAGGGAVPETGTGYGGPSETGKLRITAAVFPIWDWTREILGENPAGAELTLLLDRGTDMHSFQPSVDDMVRISSCDLFLYVGGESDQWAADALAEAANPDLVAVNLMELLGDAAREEEPGAEDALSGDDGRDGETEYDGDDGRAGETEYDEHVWLSLRNARLFCGAIADALSALDPENAASYERNYSQYAARLEELDTRYEDAVREARVRTLLFGDRFPFRYLAEDYSLDWRAAFAGCSAETEASFETVVYLAGQADELDLPAVLTIDGGDGKLARTIAQTAGHNLKILELDSMQSVTREDIVGGETYLGVMERNLDVLREALS